MPSKTLPIEMAPHVAFTSLAPARKVVVSGRGAFDLATLTTARAACEGQVVRIICGDNRFDPYVVARFARSKGIKAEAALDCILIARAFTAYQFVELVERFVSRASAGPVINTGPCSTLFDEDVSFVDAARLFYRVLWRIAELARGEVDPSRLLLKRTLTKNLDDYGVKVHPGELVRYLITDDQSKNKSRRVHAEGIEPLPAYDADE